MQFDKTRIAIRQRDWLEVMDLSLQVLRQHALPITVAFIVGAGPMILLNNWLLGEWAEPGEDGARPGFVYFSLLMLLAESPLATAPVTLYLGQALFNETVRPRQIARDFGQSFGQLTAMQVVPRVLLMIIPPLLLLPFIFWPYLGEVVLLERTPRRARAPYQLSTGRRSSILHAGSGGELFAKALVLSLFGLVLILVLWLSMWYLRGMLSGRWDFDRPMYTIGFQLSAWIVATYYAIVRFLSYLDLRIRREGWEVELLLRAERARMARQLV